MGGQQSLDRYTRRDENFVLVRSNRAITVAARNRRLALVTNILSRDSDGAVPVAARDIKGASPCLVVSCWLLAGKPRQPRLTTNNQQLTTMNYLLVTPQFAYNEQGAPTPGG